jgi:hypothetical protein
MTRLASWLELLSRGDSPIALLRFVNRSRSLLLITDPESRRRRGRRALKIMVPAYTVIFTVAGYLLEGWGAAVFFFVIALLGSGLGVWFVLRILPR